MEDAPTTGSSPVTPASDARTAKRGPRDPGTPMMALCALILSLLTIGAVMVKQQLSVHDLSHAKAPAKADDNSMFGIFAKGYLKTMGTAFNASTPEEKKTLFKTVVEQVDQIAATPQEKLRAAIVGGELGDATQSLEMLDKAEQWARKQSSEWEADHNKGLEIDASAKAEFESDLSLLRRYYRAKIPVAEGETRTELNTTDIQTVKDRFGWFGRLAAVYGDAKAPDRTALFAGGPWILVLMLVIVAGLVMGVLLGFVCFIVVVTRLLSGRTEWRFVPPSPGGSVYLETLAVFALSFLGLQLLLGILTAVLVPKGSTEPPEWFSAMHLGLQWLLALVPLYPLLRGVSFAQWRKDIGFVAPRGVLREIGAGLFAYFAGLPVFLFGVVVSLILKLLLEAVRTAMGGGASPPASNPIFEELMGTNTLTLILLVSLATIWAPFVEESIFRGALFRHLRSRTGLIVAGAVSAVAFGVMHGYEFVLLGPVISLGFVFALMREWRQSIIPSITAHMLHNGTVMVMAICMLRLIAE